MSLLIGEILGNRYQIEKLIGEGGMALVYLAKDNLLDRPVAIKVLRPEYSSDQEFLERFQREAKSAAKLCHPNVVNIYDVGQRGNTYYIVMEYIEGKSLKELIQEQGQLPVDLSLKIAIQISSALNHAHNNLIVHRDIKPHNIMITKDYRVKVMDFGIARAISSASITRTGVVLGSVHYFSPEQATGKEVTSASDLYSLGIVLYEMLTGKVPFEGDTPVGIAYQHVQAEIPSILEKRPDIPLDVVNIVNKALAKKPEDRFHTALEMEQKLSEAFNRIYNITPDKIPYTQINHLAKKENEQKTDEPRAIDATTIKAKANANNDSTMVFDQTQHALRDERDILSMSKKDNKEEKSSTNKTALKFILILLLVMLPLYLVLKVSMFLNVPEVVVPNIIGLTQDSAQTLLDRERLGFEIEAEVFDPDIPKGYVISQQPAADRKVKVNRNIRVILSKGPELIVVPDLLGLDIREAQVELQNKALEAGEREYVESDDVLPGKIIEQFPEAFTEVEKGTKVSLKISKAPLTTTFLMPDLTRRTRYEAELILSQNNLELGEVYTQYDSFLPENYVIDHNPPANSEVVEGSIVDITISAKGEPLSKPDSSLSTGLPEDNSDLTIPEIRIRGRKEREVSILVTRPGVIKIVVIDEKGSHDVYRAEHREGDFIQKVVGGMGIQGIPDVFIQVWLDGDLLNEVALADISQ